LISTHVFCCDIVHPALYSGMKSLDPARTALLLIDVINDFDFPGSDDLLRHALPAARKMVRLKKRMHAAGVPVIYVNDNFGHWQSDFREQIERCADDSCKGNEVAKMLLPSRADYFVLKPKHSGFYSTSLDVLLGFLGVDTLVLCGFAGDICVLYTANDAYMREYQLIIASDCIASESDAGNKAALKHMRTLLKARVVVSSRLR
jgi:nicotinamidase-related amidase